MYYIIIICTLFYPMYYIIIICTLLYPMYYIIIICTLFYLRYYIIIICDIILSQVLILLLDCTLFYRQILHHYYVIIICTLCLSTCITLLLLSVYLYLSTFRPFTLFIIIMYRLYVTHLHHIIMYVLFHQGLQQLSPVISGGTYDYSCKLSQNTHFPQRWGISVYVHYYYYLYIQNTRPWLSQSVIGGSNYVVINHIIRKINANVLHDNYKL